ncbi:MAG: hypothetical protein R3B06_24925 [Kofleriaceae bacterium]
MTRIFPPRSRPARSGALVLALATTAACGGDVGDERVGTDIAHLQPALTCVPRGTARPAGVTPDGELWMVGPGQTSVIDLDGTTVEAPWALDDASVVQPWSTLTAAAIVDGEVWTVSEGVREYVPTPTALGATGALCGFPSAQHGAFVATAGGLIERSSGLWWQWTPSSSTSFGTVKDLARIDGACTAADGAVWMTNQDGALWRITREAAEIVAGATAPISEVAIVPGEGAAVRTGGELSLGLPWRAVVFDAGPVERIASGGGRLWVVAGGITFVRTAGAWAIVDGLAAAPAEIFPDAAGAAWLAVGDQLCRAATDRTVRVDGLLPFEQRVAPLAQLRVVPTSDETEVTIDRDGATVATAPVVDGVATLSDVDLGGGGWHQLTVKAGASARLLEYNLLQISDRTWTTDIQPIFEANCGGTRCHGPAPVAGQIDLSTYDGWRSKASRVRERLLAGTMPPSGPRLDSATVDIVLDWIEGGLQP